MVFILRTFGMSVDAVAETKAKLSHDVRSTAWRIVAVLTHRNVNQ